MCLFATEPRPEQELSVLREPGWLLGLGGWWRVDSPLPPLCFTLNNDIVQPFFFFFPDLALVQSVLQVSLQPANGSQSVF